MPTLALRQPYDAAPSSAAAAPASRLLPLTPAAGRNSEAIDSSHRTTSKGKESTGVVAADSTGTDPGKLNGCDFESFVKDRLLSLQQILVKEHERRLLLSAAGEVPQRPPHKSQQPDEQDPPEPPPPPGSKQHGLPNMLCEDDSSHDDQLEEVKSRRVSLMSSVSAFSGQPHEPAQSHDPGSSRPSMIPEEAVESSPSPRGVLVRQSTLEVPKINVHGPGIHSASDSQAIVAFHGPRLSLSSAVSSAMPVSPLPSSRRQSVDYAGSRRPSILRQGTAPASLGGNKGDATSSGRVSLTSRPSIMKSAMSEGRDRRLSAPESFMVHAAWASVEGFLPSQNIRTSRRRSQFLGEEALAIEEEPKRKMPQFFDKLIVHPSALKVMLWDFLGLMLIFYDCISVPLEVFGFQPETQPVTLAFEWIIRIFWTMNFAGCFLTGYMKTDGSIELRFEKVLRHYLLTWFTFDFFVVFFDWAEVIAGVAASNVQSYVVPLRTARLVRTVRLARLLKAPEITKKITEHLPFPEHLAVIGELAKIMGLCLWVAHLIACAWFGIGHIGRNNSETSWIDLESIYEMTGPDQYCRSFHWSMAVFSGDSSLVPPQNNYERVFVTLTLFLAFLFSAWYVGRITTSMTRLQIITSEQSTKLAVLRRFLLDHNISRQLAVRVQRNAQFAMLEQKSKAPEKNVELLKVISPPVLIEVHYEIHSKVLNQHPFFLYYNEVNPAGIRKVCHQAVDMLSLSQGDVLFSEMEVPTEPRMFFVVAGRFNYLKENSAIPVQEDHWMSEAGLWASRWTHCGTAKAMTETRLLTLHADYFQDIVCTYPSAHASLYSMEFVEWLNDRPKDQLSDILPDKEETLDMVNRAFPDEDSGSETSEEEAVGRRDSTGQWFSGPAAFVKKFSDKPPGQGRSSGQSGGRGKKRSSDRGSQSEKSLQGILSRFSASRLSRRVSVMFNLREERHSACSPRVSSANGG